MPNTGREMHLSSLEVVGVLPCPATKSNQGAADLLETQLFAYGVGSSIAIVEVQELQLACLLQGGHRNHPVTSVKWCPDCHSRDLKTHGSHVRLASGDAAGGVVVWSLLSGSVISRLEDHFAVRDHIRTVVRGRDVPSVSVSSGGAANTGSGPGGGPGGGGGVGGVSAAMGEGAVAGLAWVMSSSAVLAVLLSPGLLLLWDTKGGAVLWKRALPAPDVWHGLQVDPLDCRSLAASSSQGGLVLLTLGDPAVERVEMRTHRVAPGAGAMSSPSSSSAALYSHFCATRGLLFLLFPREIVVYDTELNTPVASRPLPPGCAPFSAMLGVYGSGVSAGTGDEGGCDCLYVGHVDGGLSVFVRSPGELRYQLVHSGRLTPPALRGSKQPPTLLAVCGGLWRCHSGDELGGTAGGLGAGGGGGGSGGAGGGGLGTGGLVGAGSCVQATPQLIHAATQRLRAAFLPPGQSHTHTHTHSHNHNHNHSGPSNSGGEHVMWSPQGPTTTLAQPPSHPHGQQQQQQPAAQRPFHNAGVAGGGARGGGGGGGGVDVGEPAAVASSRSGAQHGVQAATSGDSDRALPQLLVLVALTGDGRVWRWDAHLPAFTAASAAPAPSVLSADQAHLHTLVGAGGAVTGGPHSAGAQLHSAAGSPVRFSAVPRSVAAAPQLAGLLHTLPSAVSTFAVYPRPVAAASLRPPAAGAEAGGGVVLLGAAGTVGGSVELFTVQRGLVSPLALHVSSSLLVHKDAPVRGVRWLGASPRLVTFSSDKAGPQDKAQWINHLIITDVRSGRSIQLPRWEYGNGPGGGGGGGGEPSPLLGVRASPCGSYLLVLVKGASAELWGVWPGASPTRLRLLDLPFSCVEWVQPQLPYSGQPVQPDDLTTWTVSSEPPPGPPLQPHMTVPPSVGRGSRESSGGGAGVGSSSWSMPLRSASGMVERTADIPLAAGAAAPANAANVAEAVTAVVSPPPGAASLSSQPPPPLPPLSPPPPQQQQLPSGHSFPMPAPPPGGLEEAQLVFTLADGRAGVLSIRGRRVADTRVKRPMAGLLSPLEISATAMAAVGRLVVMGDAEGRLAVWEWSTGRTTLHATGLGLVRKIVISPAVAGAGHGGGAAARPSLSPPPPPSLSASAPSLILNSESSLLKPLLLDPSAASPPQHSSTVADFPPPPSSSSSPHGPPIGSSTGGMKARVAVLFATGHSYVFDMDSTNKLRPVVATAAAGVRPVLDLALLPFWWIDPGAQTVGGGDGSSGNVSLMAVVTDEGSLSVLDLSPAAAVPLPPASQQPVLYPPMASPLRPPLPPGPPLGKPNERVLGGGGGGGGGSINADVSGAGEAKAPLQSGRRLPPAGGGCSRGWALAAALQPQPTSAAHSGLRLHLAQARGLASCLLLPRPWALLLRLLLQLGVSQELLRYLCGAYSPGEAEEEDVRLELLALFPRAARGPLLELLADRGRLDSQSSYDVYGPVPPPPPPPQQQPSHAVASDGSGSNPASGALWIPTQATSGGGGGGVATAKAATPAASGSSSTGAAASTILALSNSLSSTAFALSSNMLRAVSSSFASTLTPGIGGGGSTAAAAAAASPAAHTAAAAAAASIPTAAADRPIFSNTNVLRIGTDGTAAGPTGGGGGGGGGGGARIGPSSPHGDPPLQGNLLQLLRMLASMRAQGRLLHPDEWLSYSRALAPGSSPAERMAAAAQVAGDRDEARFWIHLPATLAAVRERERERAAQEYHIPGSSAAGVSGTAAMAHASAAHGRGAGGAGSVLPYRQLQRTASASASAAVAVQQLPASEVAGPSSQAAGSSSRLRTASASGMMTTANKYEAEVAGGAATSAGGVRHVGGVRGTVLLWDERLVLAEAQERIKWREAHSGAVLDMGPEQQERRLLEYMSVGDLQTAVAFLLASSPENSARYYRDALCTLALAAAASAAAVAAPRAVHGGGGGGNSGGNVCMLLAQSAKVISAHAASIGDVLLGVPLHLAAGLHAEAALVLQESGMWRLASVMTAHSLTGTERAQTLQRWALHVWRLEGSVWRGVGLLAAAGCLQEALRLLLDAGLPDCAAAFVAACK
ncbi:hypothetical protein Vretimale_7287, partial [Volvox reticuliferus]